MNKSLIHAWLVSLAIGPLALHTGCAGMQKGSTSPWLSLPSPWATVKDSPKTMTASDSHAPAPVVSSKTASRSKGTSKDKAKEEESVAMALLRGRNCERAGEWDKARQIYEGLRQQHPDNVEVAHRLGVVADAQRHHAEAEQLFLVALQKEPQNATLLSDLGYCYFLQGQLPKAEPTIQKATILEPSNPRHWNNLGLVVGHLGRHQEALAHFRRSGSEADAQYNLAFVYASQERVAEAKACFQAALAADPAHRRAREALTSFEDYERLPKYLRDMNELADNGVRYVPYIEGANANPTASSGNVALAAGQESVSTSQNASKATRALHMESRGMLNRNMASQRTEEMAGQ